MTNKPEAYIGIDPGSSGSIALLTSPGAGNVIFFHDLKNSIPINIMNALEEIKEKFAPRIIMIEKVHAIQGTSAGSNFKFGYNVGLINALSEASGIGVSHVNPKSWQKKIGVTAKGKAIKKQVAEIAEKIYPLAEIRGPRGGLLDGRSDALMIAHVAFLTYTGQ